MINQVIILEVTEKSEERKMNWPLIANRSSQQTSVLPNGLAVSETGLNYPCERASAALIATPPKNATPYPLIPIVFGLFWIIGVILFVDLNNEFELELDLKCEFVNVENENYFIHGDFDNGPLFPTPSPTFYFNNNDSGLPGMDFVEYASGGNDNENGFEYGIYYCRRKRRKRI